MKVQSFYDISKGLTTGMLCLIATACSSVVTKTELLEVDPAGVDAIAGYEAPAQQSSSQGVRVAVWEEPMVDVVDVPPGLDPEGHYYRPAHQEAVEIRQGRWQYYRRNSTAGR